ncbi:MAG TPA: DUF1579 family protein [Terriglobales bacterium]|jgi:hypothetical protein|nr:DUF1579 family protein [Terriglobales bacterium]
MKRVSTLTFVALMFSAMLSVAQAPSMPKPAPELEKAKYFLGDWKMSGDVKPGPMGPGGKFTGTQRGQWMAGKFFVVFNSTSNLGPMKVTSTGYLGYNSEDKVYTYHEFSSNGEMINARGTVDGDTWTWTSEEKMQGKVMKGRFIEKITSPTSYEMKFEASMDGGEYVTLMEAKATKAGASAKGGAKEPATAKEKEDKK